MRPERCWMRPCGSLDCAEFGPKDCPRLPIKAKDGPSGFDYDAAIIAAGVRSASIRVESPSAALVYHSSHIPRNLATAEPDRQDNAKS